MPISVSFTSSVLRLLSLMNDTLSTMRFAHCCRFSRSMHHGTLVEILEVWKLQRLVHVFWCSGVIWYCHCHYVLRFYLRSIALRYSTCSDNALPTPHPTHLSQLQYHVPFFVSTYLKALPLMTKPFLLGSNWQLFLP